MSRSIGLLHRRPGERRAGARCGAVCERLFELLGKVLKVPTTAGELTVPAGQPAAARARGVHRREPQARRRQQHPPGPPRDCAPRCEPVMALDHHVGASCALRVGHQVVVRAGARAAGDHRDERERALSRRPPRRASSAAYRCCTSWSVESPAFGQLLTPKLPIFALALGSLSFWKRASAVEPLSTASRAVRAGPWSLRPRAAAHPKPAHLRADPWQPVVLEAGSGAPDTPASPPRPAAVEPLSAACRIVRAGPWSLPPRAAAHPKAAHLRAGPRQPVVPEAGLGGGAVVSCVPYELVRGVSGCGPLLTPKLPIFVLALGSAACRSGSGPRARLASPLHHRALPRWSRCQLRAVLYELVRGISGLWTAAHAQAAHRRADPRQPVVLEAGAPEMPASLPRPAAVEPLSAASRAVRAGPWSLRPRAAAHPKAALLALTLAAYRSGSGLGRA